MASINDDNCHPSITRFSQLSHDERRRQHCLRLTGKTSIKPTKMDQQTPGKRLDRESSTLRRRQQKSPSSASNVLTIGSINLLVLVAFLSMNSNTITPIECRERPLIGQPQNHHHHNVGHHTRMQPMEGQDNDYHHLQSLHKSLEEAEATSSQPTQVNESGQPNQSTATTTRQQHPKQQNDVQNSSASRPSASAIKRLLVSQLSDLIMNNEPERIADQMRGQKLSGQILSETKQDQEDDEDGDGDITATTNDDDDDEDADQADDDDKDSLPVSLDDEFNNSTSANEVATPNRVVKLETLRDNKQAQPKSEPLKRIKQRDNNNNVLVRSENNNKSSFSLKTPNATAKDPRKSQVMPVAQALEFADAESQPQTTQQEQPQQDDPSANQQQQQDEQQQQGGNNIEDQTVTCSPDYEDQSMLEAASGGNLTAEQQQQLLMGADTAGLLSASNDSTQQQQHQKQLAHSLNQQIGQCVQPGSQMIETITKVITPILFSVIIVVGLLGNIIVMLVILEDRKTERELTPTNLLILDLSLADLSFILFCIPFTGWDYAVGHWVFGPLWCQFNQYLIVVCALSSIYTLVLMSCDRFMAIVYPIECISYRTSQNMLKAIYIKWIVILLIALPTWTMHGLIDSPLGPDQYNCRFLADQYNPLHFQIIFFITSYLFPLILIFCLYLTLLNKLWFGSKPHGHKESLKMLESKKKVTWLVAGIVVVFALCWCPIQVMLILMRLKSHKITATYVAIQVFAHTLGYMNSCINPIVYAFASETFHQSFKRSWLGRLIKWLFCCESFKQPTAPGYGNNNHNHTHSQQNTMNNNNSQAYFRRHSTMTATSQQQHQTQQLHHNQQLLQPHHQVNDRFINNGDNNSNNQLGPAAAQQQIGGGCTINGFDSIVDEARRCGKSQPRVRSLNNIFGPPPSLSGGGGGNGNGNNNNNGHQQRQDHEQRRSPLEIDGSNSTSTLITTPQHEQQQHDCGATPDKQHHQRLQNGDQIVNNNTTGTGSSFNLSRRQPLPLEPRDRPTIIGGNNNNNNNAFAQTRQQQQTTLTDYTNDCSSEDQSIRLNQMTATTTTAAAVAASAKATNRSALIPRQPTATESVFSCPVTRTTTTSMTTTTIMMNNSNNNNTNKTKVPAKQQLVARMVNQSNGNNQISHQFEPFEDDDEHHQQDDGRRTIQHAD